MSTSTSTSTKRKKDKSKKPKASLAENAPEVSARNEGVDLNWAYQPPPGVKAITTNEDNGEFDWDAVKEDDDVEVWVIRVPDNVKPKHLEGVSLDLATSDSSSKKRKPKTSRIGSLKRKHLTYDVWSLGDEDTDANLLESQMPHPVGGEELRSLTCLLPRKSKKGRLYPAPRPIARHLMVSAQPPEPSTSETSSTATSTTIHKNPPRHKYSEELLTHRFMPYGSLVDPNYVPPPSPDEQAAAEPAPMMEVDGDVLEAASEAEVEEREPTRKKNKKKKGKAEKAAEEAKAADADEVMEDIQAEPPKMEKEKKKGKKRKGEDQGEGGASTKKSKKAKTSR